MLDKLKEILAKVLPDLDMSTVTADTHLIDDLGFDSLALMMMSMEIEDAFGFRFKEFVKFETVGDVCTYLESRIWNTRKKRQKTASFLLTIIDELIKFHILGIDIFIFVCYTNVSTDNTDGTDDTERSG